MRIGRLRLLAGALAVGSMIAVIPGVSHASAPAPLFTYATMSDGVTIALAVSFPNGFDPTVQYPTLLMVDGYAGGAQPLPTSTYGRDKYVLVHASLRGTGCSGGRFQLFDRRGALDGRELIDTWIPSRSWSNGRVGLIGHSYPGLTGFWIAETQPTHLYAMTLSGLIDDLYRGIVYPGGVPNYGFPAEWTVALRPTSELSGNASRYQSETAAGDTTCATNIATRPAPDALDNPVLNGIVVQDSQWFASHSLVNNISAINRPILITQQYQDEQTGPRGGHVLWQKLPRWIPKKLILTNGVHATNAIANTDKNDWLDCFIIDKPADRECGADSSGHAVDDPFSRVQVHFETTSSNVNPAYVSSDWPLPETSWTRYYLRADGTLSTAAGGAGEASTSYTALPAGRQTTGATGTAGNNGLGDVTFVSGPDAATWHASFNGPTAIAGPILLTLAASSTNVDTDFFVDLLDYNTVTGEYQYLQRGMQRASHRAIDPDQSDYVRRPNPAEGTLYRAWEPHSNIQPIVPGQQYTYQIEVFPLGHVFRPGHQLVVSIHAPAPVDPLSVYSWVSGFAGENTVIQANGASSILLPIMPTLPPITANAPACGEQIGVPCFKPVA